MNRLNLLCAAVDSEHKAHGETDTVLAALEYDVGGADGSVLTDGMELPADVSEAYLAIEVEEQTTNVDAESCHEGGTDGVHDLVNGPMRKVGKRVGTVTGQDETQLGTGKERHTIVALLTEVESVEERYLDAPQTGADGGDIGFPRVCIPCLGRELQRVAAVVQTALGLQVVAAHVEPEKHRALPAHLGTCIEFLNGMTGDGELLNGVDGGTEAALHSIVETADVLRRECKRHAQQHDEEG